MTTIDSDVATAFNVASLLLVFVTLLFGIRYPEASRMVSKSRPAGDFDREVYVKELKSLRDGQLLPMSCLATVAAWLLVPLAVRIITHSDFALWNFDIGRTGFVAIAVLMGGLAVWSWLLFASVGRRLAAMKK